MLKNKKELKELLDFLIEKENNFSNDENIFLGDIELPENKEEFDDIDIQYFTKCLYSSLQSATPNNKYIPYLINLIINNNMNMEYTKISDIYHILVKYEQFKQNNPRSKYCDINKIQDILHMNFIINTFDVDNKRTDFFSEDERILAFDDSILLFNNNDYLLFSPTTKESLDLWSKDTKWENNFDEIKLTRRYKKIFICLINNQRLKIYEDNNKNMVILDENNNHINWELYIFVNIISHIFNSKNESYGSTLSDINSKFCLILNCKNSINEEESKYEQLLLLSALFEDKKTVKYRHTETYTYELEGLNYMYVNIFNDYVSDSSTMKLSNCEES